MGTVAWAVVAWILIGLAYLAATYKISWNEWRRIHPGLGNVVFRLVTFAVIGPLVWIAAAITLLYRQVKH